MEKNFNLLADLWQLLVLVKIRRDDYIDLDALCETLGIDAELHKLNHTAGLMLSSYTIEREETDADGNTSLRRYLKASLIHVWLLTVDVNQVLGEHQSAIAEYQRVAAYLLRYSFDDFMNSQNEDAAVEKDLLEKIEALRNSESDSSVEIQKLKRTLARVREDRFISYPKRPL